MKRNRIRIGIDVGGTFTDAVALDDLTHELLGQIKVPTTHEASEGVALGIRHALLELLESLSLSPVDVSFIAHGTTQATNALLEGDVARTGILAAGTGIEGARVRSETRIDEIELAPGRFLRAAHRFVAPDPTAIKDGITSLRDDKVEVIVAAAAFAVDDPSVEILIMDAAREQGLPTTSTHEITKLYGLRVRTRTAVVNASILPKMVATADMTEASVAEAGIVAPLMVMRCDGGVMNVAEVRKRPILTILSGPAAGVAGALIYEKASSGLFLEVGGTSTDVSAVCDGKVMVDYARVGGHPIYIRSLDVRTVGVAGGSMIRVGNRVITDLGPRSAHIAGLRYACYTAPEEIIEPSLELFSPLPGDPADYIAIRLKSGERIALTTSCAANALELTTRGSYAYADPVSARLALAPLAQHLNISVADAAAAILKAAAAHLTPVAEALMEQYKLNRTNTVLIGGGGGAAAIVPYLAGQLKMQGRLARNHQVISPIGVALALVREVVERGIPSPTEADLLRIRREAEEAAVASGAVHETLEVVVEVDPIRNLVRATATGSTELKASQGPRQLLSDDELSAIARTALGTEETVIKAAIGGWRLFEGVFAQKSLFGLITKTEHRHRLIDEEGVVRLSKSEMEIELATVATWQAALDNAVRLGTRYGDSGASLPEIFVVCGRRLIDLSSLASREQIVSLLSTELSGYATEVTVGVLYIKRPR